MTKFVEPLHKSQADVGNAAHAEGLSSMWLARFNTLDEAGNGKTKRALYCLDRAQHWLDKANEARGWN